MSDDGLWTADDIRKNAPNWTLHCDAKLLEFMKNFSKNIENRGNRINNKLHSSMLELDRTKIALENTTNQLMALQYKQFVENRVYDDDETLANVENVPSENAHSSEPKPTVIDALRNALDTGVGLMDKYFDRVTYELSDSEDEGEEEVQKSVIYRPKNPYQHRPLPYLIGSKEWHEKWHIGLAEEESEESDNEQNEEVSLSSSPAASLSSIVPVSLSESENPTGVSIVRKSDSQDLFNSSSDEDIPRNKSTFRKQSSEESKEKQNVAQPEPKDINVNNSIFRPQKAPIMHAIPTLIDSEPPQLDDVPVRSQKPPNLFLDDENDEDDFNIFNDGVEQQTQKQTIQSQNRNVARVNAEKPINLFADDDDNFDSFLSKSKAPPKTKYQKANLFEDDDGDDEFFLQPETTKPAPRSTILSDVPKTNAFQYNLFDDQPPDDFENRPVEKSNIIAAEKSKKSTDLFKTNVNLFDDYEDDDDIFEKLITPSKKEKAKQEKIQVDFDTEINNADEDENLSTYVTDSPKVLIAKCVTPEPIVTPVSPAVTSTQSTNKPSQFDSMRLFDDAPPSDDEQLFSSMSRKDEVKPKEIETRKVATEFYNDFSDTITAKPKLDETDKTKVYESVSESQKPPIIHAKPSEKVATSSAFDREKSPDEKRSDFLKKIDTFSNVHSSETETESIPRVKPAKKLNIGNIDINVAALLPGAKRSTSFESGISKKVSNDEEVTAAIGRTVSQDNVDSTGRLTNLNRDRVKNVSRRPSTRTGRKLQYEKSLLIENDEASDDCDKTDSIQHVDSKPSTNTLSPTVPTLQSNEISEFVEEDSNITVNVSSSPPKDAPILDQVSDENNVDEIDLLEENASIQSPDEFDAKEDDSDESKDATKNENPFSFLEDEIEDNYDFFATVQPTEDNRISPITVKATPAYFDELPPDLDPVDDKPPISEKTNTILSQNALSLFGDDDDDFDNDDIFTSVRSTAIPSDIKEEEDDWSPYPASYVQETPPATSQHVANSALELFDDELDNDDLFSSKVVPKSHAEPKMEQKPEPDTKLEPDPKLASTFAKPTTSTKAPSKKGLFGDDDDNDDLFGPPPLPEPVKNVQTKKVASKIFGDDSSDDDLFGGGKKSKKTQPKASVQQSTSKGLKSAKESKVSDKLFSDSEDDDLFGSKSKSNETGKKSVAAASTSKTVKEDVSKSIKALSPSSADNDPLADLLK